MSIRPSDQLLYDLVKFIDQQEITLAFSQGRPHVGRAVQAIELSRKADNSEVSEPRFP